MALPHVLEAQCGTWRDWVLGMTVVLADGTIAKCGSKVVKNVAGYDVQKLFVGSRQTLGIIVQLTLRTYPLRALPEPEVEVRNTEGIHPMKPVWLHRTLATDFSAALRNAGDRIVAIDHATHTLWALVPPSEDLPRFESDWVLRSGCGPKNIELTNEAHVRLMRRAKSLFDPNGKLNPGEMVIF
jgi:FAD/FMN-containing dehydrogenase